MDPPARLQRRYESSRCCRLTSTPAERGVEDRGGGWLPSATSEQIPYLPAIRRTDSRLAAPHELHAGRQESQQGKSTRAIKVLSPSEGCAAHAAHFAIATRAGRHLARRSVVSTSQAHVAAIHASAP